MKMHKISIFFTGIFFLGLAAAQAPNNMSNVAVCLQGDGRVVPGQELRAFTVSLTGAANLGGYFELATAAASQYNSFAVTAPRKISVVEPKNQSFMCSQPLAADTHSIKVVIHYPADYLPYCTVIESSSFADDCQTLQKTT